MRVSFLAVAVIGIVIFNFLLLRCSIITRPHHIMLAGARKGLYGPAMV